MLDVRETKELAEGGRCRTPCTSRCRSSSGASARSRRSAARPVIVYCARGQRSRGAGGALAKAGFKDVYHLTGGLAAWRGGRAPGGEVTVAGGDDVLDRRVRVLRPAERLLASKGVTAIDKVRVDLEPARRQEMMERTGRRTVPQIYIGEVHVGGYDDLVALDRAGRLDPLLGGPAGVAGPARTGPPGSGIIEGF